MVIGDNSKNGKPSPPTLMKPCSREGEQAISLYSPYIQPKVFCIVLHKIVYLNSTLYFIPCTYPLFNK